MALRCVPPTDAGGGEKGFPLLLESSGELEGRPGPGPRAGHPRPRAGTSGVHRPEARCAARQHLHVPGENAAAGTA